MTGKKANAARKLSYDKNESVAGQFTQSTSSAASGETIIRVVPERRQQQNRENLQTAIYSHIQAIRALGKTRINTAEIADALSLPITVVNREIEALKRKGIKEI